MRYSALHNVFFFQISVLLLWKIHNIIFLSKQLSFEDNNENIFKILFQDMAQFTTNGYQKGGKATPSKIARRK